MGKLAMLLTGFASLLLFAAAPQAAEKVVSEDFETVTITTSDGVQLHVEIAGEGRPCLFLHGGPGASSDWMRKLSNGLLEKYFRMIYLDQRGAGQSTSPDNGDYSMDRMVADFEEVRAALGIGKWLTMGHSFGGILQMGYIERRPEAITGMIMLNTTLALDDSIQKSWIPKATEVLGIKDAAKYYDKSVPLMTRLMPLIREMQEKDVFWKFAYASKNSEQIMDRTNEGVPKRNHDLQYAAADLAEYHKDYRPASAQVSVPVLFFYGTKDWMAGPEHYKGVHFPNMVLFRSEVGHFAIIDKRDDLDAAIAAYLEKYRL
jgi:proline iminopeptidase